MWKNYADSFNFTDYIVGSIKCWLRSLPIIQTLIIQLGIIPLEDKHESEMTVLYKDRFSLILSFLKYKSEKECKNKYVYDSQLVKNM